jgi:tRNA dimethylallyltransferase
MISFPREYPAGDYARDFHEELECIKKKYPFAIVVGGTGFYFQAIEKGMFEAGKADEEVMVKIKRELEEKDGPENLYKELLAVDPDSAKTIHQNDYYRLQRALGIWRTKGISISDLKKQMSKLSFPYPLRKFSIHADKILLEEKILKRTQAMLKLGLISEVEELLNKGYRYWAPMKSVGYRETIDFIDGKVRTQAELKENIMISTRQLAKKQRTWFQRDTDVVWVTQENAVSLIEESIF